MSPQCADAHRRFGAGLMRWRGAIFGLSWPSSGLAALLHLPLRRAGSTRAEGHVHAITFEHASARTGVHHLTVEGIAA
jgi:hypothetical protein